MLPCLDWDISPSSQELDLRSSITESHPVSGMWKVSPDFRQHECLCSVVHLDTFIRGPHLLPVFCTQTLPLNFDYTHSLDAFSAYYVNHFADHHAHETIF
jgi:hypothetical protein